MPDVYESAEEAAEAIGVTLQTIRTWIKNGQLRGSRIRGSRGHSNWRITHADLVAASRGTMFEESAEPPQLRLDSDLDWRRDALSLQVIWPMEKRVDLFTPDLLTGFKKFRAVTYTVSIPMIFKLLADNKYEDFEVIFGSEKLASETDAARIITMQRAMDEELTKGFVGMGGVGDPKTKAIIDLQASGQARFLAMSASVVHSKIYLLEREDKRRVLAGSANLSRQALSGKQGEVLFGFDDDDFHWNELSQMYEALRSQASTSLSVEADVKPAHLVAVEDLPVSRQIEKSKEPVTLYVQAPSDIPGDTNVLAVREEELSRTFGPSFRDHLKPTPKGEVTVTPATLRLVRRDVSSARPIHKESSNKLTYSLDKRFLYNSSPIERPDHLDLIDQDAYLLTRYINNYHEFGRDSEILQRNYFAVMAWLYFAPFMSRLRRERSKLGPGNFDCKTTALLYGPSNCGKSNVIEFLYRSMLGHPPRPFGDRDFVTTKVLEQQYAAGVCPLFYDDIRATRFTSGGRHGGDSMGEAIIKAYDRLHHQLPEIPCLVATLNSEAREFSNEVRKRVLLVYTSTPLPSDNTELGERMDREAKELHNRISTNFFREYLFRMEDKVSSEEDWASFDYLAESSNLLFHMFKDSLRDDEVLPEWCRRISSRDFDDFAWEPKRNQMKMRLESKLYSAEYPPESWHWTLHGDDIVLGVDDVTQVLREKEFPDHIINREASSGASLYLRKDETEAFIRRGSGDGEYRLPAPRGRLDWLKRRLPAAKTT